MAPMRSASDLVRAYDEQLRTDAETPGALAVTRHGPLRLVTFRRGRGFITYRDLDGADEAGVRDLVAAARAHFEALPEITEVEWKTRGHDEAPGLHEALLAAGFEPDEPESIMIGEARALAVDVPLADGIVVRRVTVAEPDVVRAASRMQAEVFGDPVSPEHAEETLRRLTDHPDAQFWVAEAHGEVVTAGRLEPVPDSDFAGIWGGATRPEWRGRGIYRALTAGRARAALALGRTLIHSDSTEYSRPILERAGLIKVSTTTPYRWRRAEA